MVGVGAGVHACAAARGLAGRATAYAAHAVCTGDARVAAGSAVARIARSVHAPSGAVDLPGRALARAHAAGAHVTARAGVPAATAVQRIVGQRHARAVTCGLTTRAHQRALAAYARLPARATVAAGAAVVDVRRNIDAGAAAVGLAACARRRALAVGATWLPAQACPQAPQFVGSWARVTHAPEQSASPAGHAQCPWAQCCP